MKENDLRIGQWYNDGGRDFQLEADNIPSYVYGGHYPNPITLTKEWLIKFGFELVDLTINGSGRVPYYEGKNKFQIEVYHGESTFTPTKDYPFYYSDGKFRVGLYSVHQLQNLYFALTGEEFTTSSE